MSFPSKELGILGDSLTFLGSIFLVLETLFRQRIINRRRESVGTAEHLKKAGFRPTDPQGTPINEQTVEDREARTGIALAWIGVSLLVLGFGVLLVKGIFGE